MRVPLRTSPAYRTPLALVAWFGMLLHLGASVCGTLACAGQMMGAAGLACCAGVDAREGDREADDASPAHTVKRAPCGCCDTQTACAVAPLGPVLEVAPSRAPAPPPVAVMVPPPALPALSDQRVASLPWQARPPPVLPSPTRSIVLLI